MFLTTVAIVMTIVALSRNGRAWKRVLVGWLAAILLSVFVVVPMQAVASDRLSSGWAAGSTLQNFGPFGGALGVGIYADAAAEAQRLSTIATVIDVVVTSALIGMLFQVASRGARGSRGSRGSRT